MFRGLEAYIRKVVFSVVVRWLIAAMLLDGIEKVLA